MGEMMKKQCKQDIKIDGFLFYFNNDFCFTSGKKHFFHHSYLRNLHL